MKLCWLGCIIGINYGVFYSNRMVAIDLDDRYQFRTTNFSLRTKSARDLKVPVLSGCKERSFISSILRD